MVLVDIHVDYVPSEMEQLMDKISLGLDQKPETKENHTLGRTFPGLVFRRSQNLYVPSNIKPSRETHIGNLIYHRIIKYDGSLIDIDELENPNPEEEELIYRSQKKQESFPEIQISAGDRGFISLTSFKDRKALENLPGVFYSTALPYRRVGKATEKNRKLYQEAFFEYVVGNIQERK